ncbi:MAG: hypothetical protein IT428_04560 [Planctomycetaceae bacterium]|nr:hypothetical protein [Planctomycetaceae bacterium]
MAKQRVFNPDERPRNGRWFFTALAGGVIAVTAAWTMYTQCRIDVPTGSMAILTKKSGKDLPNDQEVAPGTKENAEYKGVQSWFLTEGRYFYNPFDWSWTVLPQEVIRDGEVGVRVSLVGDELPYGEFLAHVDANGEPTSKGIVPGVLRPGRYAIHPYLFKLERKAPVTIPGGFKGVVTNLAGPLAPDPNKLLVPKGYRGVQEETLDSGTYYINPYEQRIGLVDCRSQRYNLAENRDMGFPSKDGFWVSLDGVIEFRIHSEKAAEVYVTYNEFKQGDKGVIDPFDPIDEEIIRKVIMPNARSFCRLRGSNELGREFIQGETRSIFQEEFQKEMRQACEPMGVDIIQALITRIRPPEKIASPVRDREIAKQQEKQYQQQILQQASEQKLAIEREMIKQKEALVKSQQAVVKLTTAAIQEQEVAVTKAEEKKAVAQFKLDAAKDEAAAIVSKGKAEADVVRFQNEADAAGWKTAVEAFNGDGGQFARFVMLQKLAPSYKRIMANTADSPIMRVFEGFEGTKGRSQETGVRSQETRAASATAPK